MLSCDLYSCGQVQEINCTHHFPFFPVDTKAVLNDLVSYLNIYTTQQKLGDDLGTRMGSEYETI